MSATPDYLDALRSQRHDVERIRSEAQAAGDLATVRNADLLVAKWALLIATLSPINDLGIGLLG